MNWYSKNAQSILDEYKMTLESGLTDSQVKEQLAKFGKNELPQPLPTPKWLLFLMQFNDPIIYILIVAAILNAVVAEPKDAIVIGFVVILNSCIGFIQEIRAAAALTALQGMVAPTARVIRNSIHLHIPTSELCVGDLIVVESGDRVPADARLIDSNKLIVDESMLTGESFAIGKSHNGIFDDDTALGDRLNVLYSGTIIQKGRGFAVVTAIGTGTEFGKISQKVVETEETVSPIQIKIEEFGKKLSIFILSVVTLIFVVGLLRGFSWIPMLLTSVGLAVSAIPEGLPVSVTITLSIGLYQMSKRKAILKKLAAVETLGSTNVICSDKTGTLTKNQMTTNMIYAGGEEYKVSGSGYDIKGEVTSVKDGNKVDYKSNKALELVSLVGALCSESKIAKADSEWKITGDATEASVMIAAEKLNFNGSDWTVNIDVPFESENQLMGVRVSKDGRTYILAKGAPEKILDRCKDTINTNGEQVAINGNNLMKEVSHFSNQGLRVLALSYTEVEDKVYHLEDLTNMTFIGFAGIQDAVREEVAAAVLECAAAGVRVVMITGDHIETARAVGKAVNIAHHKDIPEALKGADLEKMTDEELFNRVPNIDVYARVAPEHKYRIVEQLQNQGNVVAMTGDGVNDAPALKKADIGVAMGSGSDVAKEAAQMILMDDNFTSIVNAIRRGRIVLKNLQHIVLYILATSFGGLLTITFSVFLGFPLPILPAQLLWINMVTDGTCTFPLAFEKEHGNVMLAPPNDKKSDLVPKSMYLRFLIVGTLMMIGTLGVFYYTAASLGHIDLFDFSAVIKSMMAMSATYQKNKEFGDFKKLMTMAFCTLAFFQIWNVQNSRSEDRSLFFNLPGKNGVKLERIGLTTNPILLGVMLFVIFLQVIAVESSIMNNLLHTYDLDLHDWSIVLSVSFSIIIIVEAMKFITALVHSKRA